jgi:nucleoside-diphosphate-sugar epimerase
MKSRKTILLTGATGFLGSHILRELIEIDKYNIIVLKRSFSNCYRISSIPSVYVKYYDTDVVDVDEIYAENKVNIIIHTATEYGRSINKITEILDTNLIFPLSLLEEGVNQGLELFVNTDSFFNKDNLSYSTLIDYSLSKKSLNIWLAYLSSKAKIANMRIEQMFGENDNKDKFVESMIQRIAIKKEKKIDLTYGHQRRDFVYVDDVVNAFLTILDTYESYKFHYKIFEVGTGSSVQLRDFILKIKEISESPTILNFGALPYRNDEIMDSKADCSELQNLGWNSKYDYSAGIAKTIKYYSQGR